MSDSISADWLLVAGNHTRNRPPHLNDRNFSSTQADGPSTGPSGQPCQTDLVATADLELQFNNIDLMDGSPAAQYPPSLDTDQSESTLSAGTITDLHQIETQIETLQYIIDHPVEPNERQPLTVEALQALECSNGNQRYHHDLSLWCQEGALFGDHTSRVRLTESMMVAHHAKSQDTDVTGSSWSVLSTKTHIDHTADHVSGAGGLFYETVAAPQSFDDDGDIVMEL
ncbi:uncharacterized protein JN550_008216 [Neoarthrinium moseri]|uniref:uncharacterized protein n=1 Tax=Neoarthrinium moseri TaxID=1658444 RepID=UPI001FDCA7B9|nr:uncharacterized protein JN550_008216 [Neoarthrinium moseri]KAI1865459.1 hypothetical protein JN550_008216 [Neoarthrinium moseri]